MSPSASSQRTAAQARLLNTTENARLTSVTLPQVIKLANLPIISA